MEISDEEALRLEALGGVRVQDCNGGIHILIEGHDLLVTQRLSYAELEDIKRQKEVFEKSAENFELYTPPAK